MKLSENFTLDELTKSQEAIRLGIANEPSDEHITNLILLCKNVLQPIRNHFKIPVSISLSSGASYPICAFSPFKAWFNSASVTSYCLASETMSA